LSTIESPSPIDPLSPELGAELEGEVSSSSLPVPSSPQVPSSWPPEKYYSLWCRFIRIFGLVTNIGLLSPLL
jgi:hypothetical protein